MAVVNLTFNSPINMSCKVGDSAYHVTPSDLGGFSVAPETLNLIGTINSITDNGTTVIVVVELEGDAGEGTITTSSFIFFSKNNLVETGSIKGYYAKTQFRNNSTKPAELHATACEIEDSSE